MGGGGDGMTARGQGSSQWADEVEEEEDTATSSSMATLTLFCHCGHQILQKLGVVLEFYCSLTKDLIGH